jgi:hypothetical protein
MGYLLADVVDGCAHIEQVTVHLAAWARARRLPAVTLTTCTEVAWNGPYYERLRSMAHLQRPRCRSPRRACEAWEAAGSFLRPRARSG